MAIELIDNFPLTDSRIAKMQAEINRDIEQMVKRQYGVDIHLEK